MSDKRRENNKRIARNTAMLYIRMLFSMAVSFYTSRVVLALLGVDDFGIYNVVGGIVVLFSFLNNAMGASTQRFLNFELGKGDMSQVKKIFSMSMTSHISIALLVLILSETVGLWLLNTHMNIPADRMSAANWVYQFSVLSCCIKIVQIPYQASIIAYERMSFYAYISIVEVVVKLLVVFLLMWGDFDRLILYAVLSTAVSLVIYSVYKMYCTRTFATCRYTLFWDAKLYRTLMSFSGWNLFGSMANVAVQQGGNILLNIFSGVAVNAALGVANQVSAAIYGFVSNFQLAFSPSITKSYASGDREYFMDLIFKASRYSYFLLFLLSLPVLLCCEFVMGVWLETVPPYAISFCRLILVYMLIDAVASPLWTSMQATGKIRNYQIMVGCLALINLPLAYAVLYVGMSPSWVLIIRVSVNAVIFVARLIYMRGMMPFSVRNYVLQVGGRIVAVNLLAVPLPLWVSFYLPDGWTRLVATTLVAVLCTVVAICCVGLKRSERVTLTQAIRQKLCR